MFWGFLLSGSYLRIIIKKVNKLPLNSYINPLKPFNLNPICEFNLNSSTLPQNIINKSQIKKGIL